MDRPADTVKLAGIFVTKEFEFCFGKTMPDGPNRFIADYFGWHSEVRSGREHV
jgi:hypothetical protein